MRLSSVRSGIPAEGGFTLMELLSVLAILAVLASAAFPIAELAARRQKEQELRYHLRQIRDAVDLYKKFVDEGRIEKKIGESGYPRRLDDLVAGVRDLRSPDGSRIYLLRRIPTDPFAPSGVSGAASWGVRSYSSPPDAPEAGDDVYDVFSRSPDRGLDGRPYREW